MFQIAVRAGNLGVAFGCGILISVYGGSCSVFGWYFTMLAFFHWSEYFTTAATNPKTIALDSFLLDHSREYQIAAVASWVEFFVEWLIFPGQYKKIKLFIDTLAVNNYWCWLIYTLQPLTFIYWQLYYKYGCAPVLKTEPWF